MHRSDPFNKRPPLWLYHEMEPHEWKRPEYYNLCLETVQKHCGRRFRVIPLTRYTIYSYIPNFRKDLWHTCTARQRTDLVKWELLARYGGLFLDQDVLVLRDLSPYMDELVDHDFVAFGKSAATVANAPAVATAPTISIGASSGGQNDPRVVVVVPDDTTQYGDDGTGAKAFVLPLTWAMASRPHGRLVSLARERCYWLLDNQRQRLLSEPQLLGGPMLAECIQRLALSAPTTPLPHRWAYFHVSTRCSQCDSHDRAYTTDRFMTNEPLGSECVRNMFLVPLGAQPAARDVFPQWFVSAHREQLLGDGNTLVSKLWRWSLLGILPYDTKTETNPGFDTMPTVSGPRFYASGWAS